MLAETERRNILGVAQEYGRNGLCVKVVIDGDVTISGDRLVPHSNVCLTTPKLLQETGIDPEFEATNDLGDRYQFTLWLPDEPADNLVTRIWSAFRGPFPKGDTSDEWITEDLRRLQHPGP